MGFKEVYDFVGGKLEWIAHGLPVEGIGPHYAVAGEVADKAVLLTCRVGDQIGEIADQLTSTPHDYCVVVNEHGIVLGRMRPKDIRLDDPAGTVEKILEPGPTTVRSTEPARALLDRMKKKNVETVIVTTNKGKLLGGATQRALDELLTRG